jgi:lysophospholipase L1-like esterase
MSTKNQSRAHFAKLFALGAIALCITGTSLAQPRGFARPQPADVPEAVVMPRPNQDEVARAAALLEEFKSELGRGDREMLDRYRGLLEVRVPPANTAIIPNLADFFRMKHEQNLEVARAGGIELLLMGDSITDFWRNEQGNFAGKPVLDEYFGHWKIANFGIAGDTTQGVLYRLQNGEGEGFSPRAVMLMIGTNNTAANNAGEIAEGVGAVVLQLQRSFPEAEILLLGIFPRSRANDPVREEIAEINEIISALDDADSVHYLDIGEVFLDEDGNIPTEIMSDGLHPGPEGYRLWAEAVQEPLTRLMAE